MTRAPRCYTRPALPLQCGCCEGIRMFKPCDEDCKGSGFHFFLNVRVLLHVS